MKRTFPPISIPCLPICATNVRHSVWMRSRSRLIQAIMGSLPMRRALPDVLIWRFKSLEEKVFQAHRKKNQTVRTQLERVAFHLYPIGTIAGARVSRSTIIIAKYGLGSSIDFEHGRLQQRSPSFDLSRSDRKRGHMKIGITCYPVMGGSGIVATELGMALAARGHQVHFISYALPFRLDRFRENVFFHEVEVSSYPSVQVSALYRCRWRRRWRMSSVAGSSICCTCTMPFRTHRRRSWPSRLRRIAASK